MKEYVSIPMRPMIVAFTQTYQGFDKIVYNTHRRNIVEMVRLDELILQEWVVL